MTNIQTLLDLKEKIDIGKVKLNKLEGQKEEALKVLSKEFGCKGIRGAKKELEIIESEIEKDTKVLNKQIENLAEKTEKANQENHKIFEGMRTGNWGK